MIVSSVLRTGALALLLLWTGPAGAQAPGAVPAPPAAEVTPDPWPKSATRDGATFTMYQPQIDTW
ncbi:MAG: hypothetical protein WCS72_19110, partial [Deltaproteobacteria bacterium]